MHTAAVLMPSTAIGHWRRQASATQATATRASAPTPGCGMVSPLNWMVSDGDLGWPSP